MKSYLEFRKAIRIRESSDRYDCVNKLGFLGAYQFGMARLCDLGLTKRKDPKSKSMANGAFEFSEADGREGFLSSTELQDACFDRHVQLLARLCEKMAPENMSGAIAACHLLGVGGLVDFVRHRVDDVDAFGTRLSEYFKAFAGYEIPGYTGRKGLLDPDVIEAEFRHIDWDQLRRL